MTQLGFHIDVSAKDVVEDFGGSHVLLMPDDGKRVGVAMRNNSGKTKVTKLDIARMEGIRKSAERRFATLQRLQAKIYLHRLLREGPPSPPPELSEKAPTTATEETPVEAAEHAPQGGGCLLQKVE